MKAIPDSLARKIELICGIDVSTLGKAFIDSQISQNANKNNLSPDDYLSSLLNNKESLIELIHQLLVPETWFMRDSGVFDFLKKVVINHKGSLKILSLPCSTGEEAYSIAITLYECGKQSSQFSIDAFDIDPEAIELAQKGLFKKRSFKNDSFNSIREYFKEVDEHYYEISEKLKESINFSTCNILDPEFSNKANQYDIIFCRNLLIYFSKKSRIQALNTLHKALKDDGILFLGHAENLHGLYDAFTSTGPSDAFAYIKAPQENIQTNTTKAKSEVTKNKEPLKLITQLANSGQYEKALAACRDFCAKNPLNASAFYLLGNIYSALENKLEAIESLKKCIYLNPAHTEALIQLKQLYQAQGNLKEARLLQERLENADL